MRLSLLCMCQMNHKPIPYAIAICWWAQAVLVDMKSRDYGGLILCEWREKRTGRQRGWRVGRWTARLSLCLSAGPQVSGFGKGCRLTPPKLSNLAEGCEVLAQPGGLWKQTNNFTCTPMTTCLSPRPQRRVVVIEAVENKGTKVFRELLLLSETHEPIAASAGAEVLISEKSLFVDKRWGIPRHREIVLIVNQKQELRA